MEGLFTKIKALLAKAGHMVSELEDTFTPQDSSNWLAYLFFTHGISHNIGLMSLVTPGILPTHVIALLEGGEAVPAASAVPPGTPLTASTASTTSEPSTETIDTTPPASESNEPPADVNEPPVADTNTSEQTPPDDKSQEGDEGSEGIESKAEGDDKGTEDGATESTAKEFSVG